MRQLRHLPGAGQDLGRDGGGAEGPVGGLPHRPALRRRAPDRRAAGQRHGKGAGRRARADQDLRRRQGTVEERMGLGVPATGGGGVSDRGHRRLRRLPPDRRRFAGDPGPADGGAAPRRNRHPQAGDPHQPVARPRGPVKPEPGRRRAVARTADAAHAACPRPGRAPLRDLPGQHAAGDDPRAAAGSGGVCRTAGGGGAEVAVVCGGVFGGDSGVGVIWNYHQ
jgi:hypothetical protein